MTSFFSILFMGPSGAASCSAAGAKSSAGGMPSLCGEQEEGKKEAYSPAGTSLQGFAHRSNYSCKSIPVREYLQTFSSDLFAAQRDDLCYHHVVYPGPGEQRLRYLLRRQPPAMPGKLALYPLWKPRGFTSTQPPPPSFRRLKRPRLLWEAEA